MSVLLVSREFGSISSLELETVITLGDEGESGISMGEEVCLATVPEGSLSWRTNPRGLDTWLNSPNRNVLSLTLRLPGEDTVRLSGTCALDSPIGTWAFGPF